MYLNIRLIILIYLKMQLHELQNQFLPIEILHLQIILLRLLFFQAEDGIRDCLLSRGLGDVYKRQQQEKTFSEVC